MRYIKNIFFISLISLGFFSCKFFEYRSDAVEVLVKSNQFILAWDLGEQNLPNAFLEIESYKIFYRPHDSISPWLFLDEIDSNGSLEYLVTDKYLEYGRYDFAVRSVNKKGQISALHSSMDRSANPRTGWYINWIGSK